MLRARTSCESRMREIRTFGLMRERARGGHWLTPFIPCVPLYSTSQKVILDSDLARVYGVEARSLNQAVARNRKQFPTDFLFQLSVDEYENMRSQIVTAGVRESNSSQIVMSS